MIYTVLYFLSYRKLRCHQKSELSKQTLVAAAVAAAMISAWWHRIAAWQRASFCACIAHTASAENNTEAAAGRHAALGRRRSRPPPPPSPLPRSRHIRRRSAMVHTGWLGRQAGGRPFYVVTLRLCILSLHHQSVDLSSHMIQYMLCMYICTTSMYGMYAVVNHAMGDAIA
jgi:hypothetical protein